MIHLVLGQLSGILIELDIAGRRSLADGMAEENPSVNIGRFRKRI